MSHGLDDRGSIPGSVRGIFLFVTASRPAPEPTQSPIQAGGKAAGAWNWPLTYD
jgi:hypothetical protein